MWGEALSLHIQIEKFEGPLALLLYLIRRDEMDVFDINVHHITQQYLEYIKAMKKLDLEVAGEFIAMAATLIHIKSRMLLPQYDDNGDEIDIDDPRKALVQRLLEYEQFQGVSKQLYDRPLVGRDIWLRGYKTEIKNLDEDEIIIEDNPLFALIRAYRSTIQNMKNTVHKVLGELQSVAERVAEIKDRLMIGQRVVFKDFIDKAEDATNQVLVTFLSFLELCKLGYVSLYQSEPLSDIYILPKKNIDSHVIEVDDAYSYLSDENILENKGDKVEISLTEEDLSNEETLTTNEAPSETLVTGEALPPVVELSEDDQPIVIEAATDEEITEEEQRLNIRAEAPKNEPEDGE